LKKKSQNPKKQKQKTGIYTTKGRGIIVFLCFVFFSCLDSGGMKMNGINLIKTVTKE